MPLFDAEPVLLFILELVLLFDVELVLLFILELVLLFDVELLVFFEDELVPLEDGHPVRQINKHANTNDNIPIFIVFFFIILSRCELAHHSPFSEFILLN